MSSYPIDFELHEMEVQELLLRGVTPRALELAYLRNEVRFISGEHSIRRAVLTALAKRWGIARWSEGA